MSLECQNPPGLTQTNLIILRQLDKTRCWGGDLFSVEFVELDGRRGGGGEELMTEGCEGEGGDAELLGGLVLSRKIWKWKGRNRSEREEGRGK